MTQPCDLRDEQAPCADWATHRAKNHEQTLRVCYLHADFLSIGGYLVTDLPRADTCRFADTGNGECGGPTSGLYCWFHKDLV